MVTTEEIERRVAEADAARTAKRSAAAKRIGELAQRRAAIAAQLGDIERELGEVLTEAADVMEITELARFTDIPAADLNRWWTSRKTSRTPRKKHTGHAPNPAHGKPSPAGTPTGSQAPARHAPSGNRNGSPRESLPVTAEVA